MKKYINLPLFFIKRIIKINIFDLIKLVILQLLLMLNLQTFIYFIEILNYFFTFMVNNFNILQNIQLCKQYLEINNDYNSKQLLNNTNEITNEITNETDNLNNTNESKTDLNVNESLTDESNNKSLKIFLISAGFIILTIAGLYI